MLYEVITKPNLPKTVGVWNRAESPRIIGSNNIFKYMNGAGELYLGYRFRHLEVFNYTSADQGNILVELYFMESPDDAFGLLSLDWGGEPVSFDGAPRITSYNVCYTKLLRPKTPKPQNPKTPKPQIRKVTKYEAVSDKREQSSLPLVTH